MRAVYSALLMIIPMFSSGGRGVDPGPVYAPPDIFGPYGFEDGAFTGLASFFPADEQNVAEFPFQGTRAFRAHYVIDASEVGSADRNRSVAREHVFQPEANIHEHFFVRGYVRLGTPTLTGGPFPVQRKLIYIQSDYSLNLTWCVVLLLRDYNLEIVYADAIRGVPDTNLYAGAGSPQFTFTTLTYYGVEIEVKVNTPGVSDGVVQMWVYDTNGATLHNRTFSGLDLRGARTDKLQSTEWGDQVNRTDENFGIDEYRWWDRIAVSTQRIGP